VLLALGLALAFALVTRLWGIDYLLPHRTEPDRELAQQVIVLGCGDPRALESPVMAKYPWLIARLASLGYDARDPGADLEEQSVDEHASRCAEPSARVRRLVAWLGLLAVPATWLLARAFLGPLDALLAACIVAASLLQHSFSQQARPHAPAASLALLALLASMRLAKHGRLRDWMLASIASALAVGALHSGIATLLPLATAAALRLRRDGLACAWRLVVPLATTVLAVVLFYPFLWQEAVGGETAGFSVRGLRVEHGDHTFDLHSFRGRGFALVARALWFYEPALGLGLALGIIVWLGRLFRRRVSWPDPRGPLLVALSFALPYFVVIGLYERTYQRFLLPLLPFFALLAVSAWRASRLRLAACGRPALARTATVLAWLALVGLPAATVCRQAWLRSQPDTYEQLARWIETNLDSAHDRIALLPPLGLPPLFQADEALTEIPAADDPAQRVYWHVYQRLLPAAAKPEPRWMLGLLQFEPGDSDLLRADPRGFVQALPYDYIALETEARSAPIEKRRTFEAILRASGARVARFAPDELDLPIEYQERQRGEWSPNYALRLWRARSIGPVIDVLRLPK
jgi:hypothetical protein